MLELWSGVESNGSYCRYCGLDPETVKSHNNFGRLVAALLGVNPEDLDDPAVANALIDKLGNVQILDEDEKQKLRESAARLSKAVDSADFTLPHYLRSP